MVKNYITNKNIIILFLFVNHYLMNHGSIGFLDGHGRLSLEQQILDGLCLGVNSKLYGIYYPCRPSDKYPEYKNVTLKHDFMLTPIPPRFWPVSARIHIHLIQQPGSFNKVCEYFQRKKISIIHGEVTRSAYRYATWSLHIAFEELLKRPKLNFNKEKNYYRETFYALKKLLNDINNDLELKPLLFLFAPDYFKVVNGNINAPLAYFTNFYKTKEDKKWLDEPDLIEPFELTLEKHNGYELLGGDKQFQLITRYLNFKDPDIFPAITFSELHTQSLNIRTVLIPPKDNKRFFRLEVQYERITGEDSCVGIIYTITNNMPPEYDIWQSYNYTINSSPEYDKGDLIFIIEDQSNIKKKWDPKSKDAYINEALTSFRNVIKENPFKNIKFSDPLITPLPDPPTLEGYFQINYEERERQMFKFDVFISYQRKDEVIADRLLKILKDHNLNPHKDVLEIEFGDQVESKLLENILDSREMCVIVSNNSSGSEWVTTEWGAAWILSKRITPIVNDTENIPLRLKDRLYIDGNSDEDLEKYAKQLFERKLKNNINRFRDRFGK